VPSFEYRRIGGEAKLQTFPAGWVILKGMLAEGVRAVRSNGVRRSRSSDAVMPTSVESPRSMVLTK
jgi:hypothetical protein